MKKSNYKGHLMKWLCLVLVATAKAALLDAQEAITSTPWISDSEEGFFSCHRYEETSSDSLGQGFPDSSEMTSLSITANILLGIALVYNFLSRKVLALPDNWQKEQATEQTVVLTHSKNPLKYLSHYTAEKSGCLCNSSIALDRACSFQEVLSCRLNNRCPFC